MAHLPGLAFDLGETIAKLRDSVQQFADDPIAPRAAEIDRDNLFPADLWRKLGALGLHGMTVKEEYGGSELGYLAHIVAMEEVSRASASVGPRTARIRTWPSIRSTATAAKRRGRSTCRSSSPASTSARWR